MELKEKKILITGGTSGLGFSVAKSLIKKGCLVNVIGRSEDNIKKAKKIISSKSFKAFKGDVRNYEEIKRITDKVGRIDILINNAGVWLKGKLQDYSCSKIDEIIDVNLKGVIYTTKLVLPGMIKRNEGFILNVSSTSGITPKNEQTVYCASKYGVTGFTNSLKKDLLSTNIKVAGFYPGGMKTKLFEKAGMPIKNKNWMEPDKVAKVIIFILEQDDQELIIDHLVLNRRRE
ncbi:hypothetical protein COT75_01950 [Candidatus Beckwithbacteria bacterium CG10_big_fil_rev_8_21_14_0_10_34_10]|uniref:NAD(P)-dependent oxidoreductase n=1 Tax=Candidatus Beckwithbacteria bacterium CG10_big_fil_rev_8_21_14_0_10_34_10 TaxID=1974495 RepID=A0A2H0W9U0_9BACT|nr:MAG: hypothetical protein COT75_01950 [Candidatus Beckwithbacteria bacterium CG10_big_fil_rev_8_21_14_0_10_34_10]